MASPVGAGGRDFGRAGSDVLVYELNEVPWRIIDLYLERRPTSTLASVMSRAQCLTTVNDDKVHLQPWRTWPTFHTGLYTEGHNSWDLGQDPETFEGETIWDVAERAGLRIGLFGVLQSWPPRQPMNGGFWVPDTFARDATTVPEGLSSFQEFNLSMTAENSFSASQPLNTQRMLRVGADIARRGLTPRSAAMLMQQLLRERREPRWKAARPVAQALPAFDLYWRLHTRQRPNLSVFFTNHVAGAMHRYWGDAVPDYADTYGYNVDDIFRNFVWHAMDIFDSQLQSILRWMDRNPGTVLVIASSMGQEPIEYQQLDNCYVLKDPRRLTDTLGLGAAEPGLAMYPMYALNFEAAEQAEHAAKELERLRVGSDPLFRPIQAQGNTLTAGIVSHQGTRPITLESSNGEARELTLDQLGVVEEERLGGANTAFHIPEGIWIATGSGVEQDSSRASFSALEAKGRLTDLLGIPPTVDAASAALAAR